MYLAVVLNAELIIILGTESGHFSFLPESLARTKAVEREVDLNAELIVILGTEWEVDFGNFVRNDAGFQRATEK